MCFERTSRSNKAACSMFLLLLLCHLAILNMSRSILLHVLLNKYLFQLIPCFPPPYTRQQSHLGSNLKVGGKTQHPFSFSSDVDVPCPALSHRPQVATKRSDPPRWPPVVRPRRTGTVRGPRRRARARDRGFMYERIPRNAALSGLC